jgi:recombinational DNA repair ATPase RecF
LKITKIILRKHKHLALRNIQELVFEPESKFQWILGTNGSGKSTLLREFSPLAAVPAHYYKGGSKVIEGVVGDTQYRLTCDFSGPKNIFSFIEISPEHGERELNPGHTSTVYTNLVLQKFRLDKDIQEIRTGRKRFTELSPNDRKSWISQISEADYTYALQYYQRLFTHYRDTMGAQKTDQNRLLEAKSKILSPEEEQKRRERLRVLKEEIHQLSELRPNPTVNYEELQRRVKAFGEGAESRLKAFRSDLRRHTHLFPLGDLESAENALLQLEIEKGHIAKRTKELFEFSEKLSGQLKNAGQSISLDDRALQERILTLDTEIQEQHKKLDFPFVDEEAEDLLLGFDRWVTEMSNAWSIMVADPQLLTNPENENAITKAIQQEQEVLRILGLQLTETSLALKKQEECRQESHVECPNCKHRWHPGFSALAVKGLEEKLTELTVKREKANERLEKHYQQLGFFVKHTQGLRTYHQVKERFPQYRAFYVAAEQNKNHRTDPYTLEPLTRHFRYQLTVWKELRSHTLELEKLKQTRVQRASEEQSKWSQMLKDQEETVRHIERLYEEVAKLQAPTEALESKIRLIKSIQIAVDKAQKAKEEWLQLGELFTAHQVRSFLGDMILHRNQELVGLEKSIREIDLQQHHVNILEKQLLETQDYLDTLKEAVTVLSPREGLIAYGLTGFINHFVRIVNSLIAKVWLYPLEIQPFVTEEDSLDLDYKFRIKVGEEIVEDISFCSEGQKEIINLAIVITSLVMLHLDHDALLLDEFGSKMDPAHRASSYKAISELLTHSNFSHVLMVSHFDESFSAHVEADVSVICDANLSLPSNLLYNKCLHLT